MGSMFATSGQNVAGGHIFAIPGAYCAASSRQDRSQLIKTKHATYWKGQTPVDNGNLTGKDLGRAGSRSQRRSGTRVSMAAELKS